MRSLLIRTAGCVCLSLTLPLSALAAAKKQTQELDLTQPFLLLSGDNAKRLQQELDQAAAAGYRVVQAGPRGQGSGSFTGGLLGGVSRSAGVYLVLLERDPTLQSPFQYRVLKWGGVKGLEGEMNEAAAEGFRLLPGTLRYKRFKFGPLGASRTLFGLMEKSPQPTRKWQYLVLERVMTGRLERDIQEAVAKGYEAVHMVEGGGYTVLMRKAFQDDSGPAGQTEPSPPKEYLLLSTSKISTLRKELQEATASGQYAVMDAIVAIGNEYLVMLEEVSSPPPVEYAVLGFNEKEVQEARVQGYEPLAGVVWQKPKESVSDEHPELLLTQERKISDLKRLILEDPQQVPRPGKDRVVLQAKKVRDLQKEICLVASQGYRPATLFLWEKPAAASGSSQ
jgi:hypothetical protein